MSMKAIAKEVGASLSSVSRWVRDVELTEEQQTTLQMQAFNGHVKGRAIHSAVRRSARVLAQEEGRQLAERREALHVAGCMLYWAEGAKDRNQIRFTNSDPEMARFFVKFLRTYFNLEDENIKITCNLFADHLERQREIERFWLETLGLPASSLCKSTINIYSKYSKKKRMNKLPYGTCRVVVSRTRIVQSIFGSIQEYAGFERPVWLE
jgi:transposase-like protein